MKAIVFEAYGPPEVLQLKEVEKPTPKENEILIKVHAASLNAADWHIMRGSPFLLRLMGFGIRKPKVQILGADVAGTVEAIGEKVTSWKVGDEVFGDISGSRFGGFAEYACGKEDAFVLKPDNLGFEEAAAVPLAAVTALKGLRDKGKIEAGQKVLINGASGGVGSFAVQIAKSFGAEVTGVCSTFKLDMVSSLGADYLIDYTQENFTQNDEKYDLILDTAAYHSLGDYKRALSPTGRFVMVGGSMTRLFQLMFLGPLITLMSKKKMGNMMSTPDQKDLEIIKELLEAETVIPSIGHRFSLPEVPEAIALLEAGKARGKIVISIS